MIIDTVESVNDYPIRLTEERWFDHIVNNKPYMSGYMEAVLSAVVYPNFVLSADDGSKVAILEAVWKLGRKSDKLQFVACRWSKTRFFTTDFDTKERQTEVCRTFQTAS